MENYIKRRKETQHLIYALDTAETTAMVLLVTITTKDQYNHVNGNFYQKNQVLSSQLIVVFILPNFIETRIPPIGVVLLIFKLRGTICALSDLLD